MATVTEISITLENKPGTLSEIVELLSSGGIMLTALTLETVGNQGTLFFVPHEAERAEGILRSSGRNPTLRPILAVAAPTHPGGLNTVLKSLKSAGVNIERFYGGIAHAPGGGPILLMAVDNPEKASDALNQDWISLYSGDFA